MGVPVSAGSSLYAEYSPQARFLEDIDFHAIVTTKTSDSTWHTGCTQWIDKSQRDLNPLAYTPRFLSMGPLHHGRPEFADMEKHKLNYANSFLERSKIRKESFVHFFKEREESIRLFYSVASQLGSRDYVEMIMLDSFFIMELIIRWWDKKNGHFDYANDPLLHDVWFRDNIPLDMMLFENQLPYRLLSELFYFIGRSDFLNVFVQYFMNIFGNEYPMASSEEGRDQFNLTYYVRHSIVLGIALQDNREKRSSLKKLKYAAKKLCGSRVKFYGRRYGCLRDINFDKRILALPVFEVDNTTEMRYCNLIGLEQSKFKDNAYICSYILLLHMLLQSSDDVAVLVEEGLIINRLDNNQAVVELFKNLSKSIKIDVYYFTEVCKELNHYCSSWKGWWNYCRKILKDGYFNNIWTSTGTIAAVILLLLTLIQTITSILQVT
ncbi:hypothetical protein ACFE04_027123 [Oxalis oulophora]